MRWTLDQFQAGDLRQQTRDVIVDRNVRRKPDMSMKKDTPLQLHIQKWRQPICAVGKQLSKLHKSNVSL
jgi:hypothetical protein